MSELIRPDDAASSLAVSAPVLIANAGPRAERRFLEFFAVTIRNRNTRAAYLRACRSFFAFCDAAEIDELDGIEPLHVAAYIEALGHARSTPTVKQHLAALRMMFDWLVTRAGHRLQSRSCGARAETVGRRRQDTGPYP